MVKVGFSTGNNILSRFIRWATKSKASHAWLSFSDSTLKQEMVMQATIGGFSVMTMREFALHHVVVAQIEPKVSLDQAVVDAADWLGVTHYDYGGLIGGLFVVIGRFFKRKIKNPFASSKALFCSEAVVKILQDAKYPGAEALVPDSTTPQDLLDFMQAK